MIYRKIRTKGKKVNRLVVDAAKLNMGNTYDVASEYCYDIEFVCIDCGITQIWTASQQKWWHEEAGGYFFSKAIRCRECRTKERERIKHA